MSIVEFGDFKCPSCKAWGEQLYPKLKEAYIDRGKSQFYLYQRSISR
ncbi:thioredoxin domain-containing protein [Paenibacillus lignilyticus]